MLTPQEIIALRDPDTAGKDSFKATLPGNVFLADLQTSSTAYGDQRNLAVALLVLHWEYLRRRNGAPTVPTLIEDGPSKRGFAAPKVAASNPLDLTAWGLELQGMRKDNILAVCNRMTL